MSQLVLFEVLPPRTHKAFTQAHRTTDPATSAYADRVVSKTGKRQSHCQEIVTCLVRLGISSEAHGLTFAEIARRLDWPHDRVHKRMQDCQRKGPWAHDGSEYVVCIGPARPCRLRHTECLTYYVRRATDGKTQRQ
jgi:hypothetical protein